MKWKPENLFQYQKIRPKKTFRRCLSIDCDVQTKFYLVRDTYPYPHLTIVERCPRCYDPNNLDEYSELLPSYLIDYNTLLMVQSELDANGYLEDEKTINFYKQLKHTINNDSYFRHLKRVNNRNKLYHTKSRKKKK